MLSLPAGQDGLAAAQAWAKTCSPARAQRGARRSAGLAAAWQGFIYDYGWQRLDEGSRARWPQGQRSGASGCSARSTAFGGVSRTEWQADPLLLTRAAVQGRWPAPAPRPRLADQPGRGRAAVVPAARRAGLVGLRPCPQQRAAEPAQRGGATPQGRVSGRGLLRRGTLFYSQHASELAQQDISTIGLGSTVGVLLLMWLAFRSLRALWISLLPIAVGLAWGYWRCCCGLARCTCSPW